jgi:adenosylhomocysteine nucleosidase
MGAVALSQPEINLNRLCLGIVAAMPAEARSVAKRLLLYGGPTTLGPDVRIWVSGIGPKRARVAANALLKEGATALLSWGSAGGLAPGLMPGSVILPRTVIAANRTCCYTDPAWHGRLAARLTGRVDLHTEPLAESRGVLARPDEKAALAKDTGAVAVDMESAAVGMAAGAARVPFMAVRVIADPSDMAIPLLALRIFGSSGRLNLPRLLAELMRHPFALPPLLRLGWHMRSATKMLSAVARLSGSDFQVNAAAAAPFP